MNLFPKFMLHFFIDNDYQYYRLLYSTSSSSFNIVFFMQLLHIPSTCTTPATAQPSSTATFVSASPPAATPATATPFLYLVLNFCNSVSASRRDILQQRRHRYSAAAPICSRQRYSAKAMQVQHPYAGAYSRRRYSAAAAEIFCSSGTDMQ